MSPYVSSDDVDEEIKNLSRDEVKRLLKGTNVIVTTNRLRDMKKKLPRDVVRRYMETKNAVVMNKLEII